LINTGGNFVQLSQQVKTAKTVANQSLDPGVVLHARLVPQRRSATSLGAVLQ